MKRIYSLLLVVALSTLGFLKAQESTTGDESFNALKYNVAKAYHWSIGATAGISVLDGDQTQEAYAIFPRSKVNFAFGANVEYTFTPQWGIFLQYLYAPYSGTTVHWDFLKAVGTPLDFKGTSHDVTINFSLNLLNLFYKYRPQTWNWYVNAGAGVNFYNTATYIPGTTTPITQDQAGNPANLEIKDGRSMVIPFGMTVEYSPLKWLAIIWDVQYRLYAEDDLDASIRGNDNDDLFYTGLGLRWKILGSDKERMHVRNMSMGLYEPDAATAIAKAAAKKADDAAKKADEAAAKADRIQPNVDFLMAQAAGEDDSDQDGVPDSRDREPNTPLGSYVNYYGEALTCEKINKILSDGNCGGDLPSIYFDLGSYQLKSYYQSTFAQVARMLNKNSKLKVEILGYCDYVGGERFNQGLSVKRAEAARNELIKTYGIDENRIEVVGMGRTKGPQDNYLPNRRCDFVVK